MPPMAPILSLCEAASAALLDPVATLGPGPGDAELLLILLFCDKAYCPFAAFVAPCDGLVCYFSLLFLVYTSLIF